MSEEAWDGLLRICGLLFLVLVAIWLLVQAEAAWREWRCGDHPGVYAPLDEQYAWEDCMWPEYDWKPPM